MSASLTREVVERGHATAVLPYDPRRDEIVLIEQFRIGPYAAGRDPWVVEIVAGIIDAGENAVDVARREAREEAGLEIDELEPVAAAFLTPGACSEHVDIFCGRTDTSDAGGIHGLEHEGEDIRVLVEPYARVQELLEQGLIANVITIVALQWLMLNRNRIRAVWT